MNKTDASAVRMKARIEMAHNGRIASWLPAAATISGDGVSPAASASANGSPPGNADETASAEDGRPAGSGSRHFRITRSMEGIHVAGDAGYFGGTAFLAQADQFGDCRGFEGAFAGEHLVHHKAQRVNVAANGDLARRVAPAPCRPEFRCESRTFRFARRCRRDRSR